MAMILQSKSQGESEETLTQLRERLAALMEARLRVVLKRIPQEWRPRKGKC